MFKEFSTFAKAAIKNPMEVSTIFPSSRFLARAVLDQVDFVNGKAFVELGSGSGAITKYLEPRLEPEHSFLGIEISSELVDFLEKNYPKLKFSATSADNLKPLVADSSIDGVISSLPWSLFPESLQQGIVDEILRVMAPDGVFVTYICVNSHAYPRGRRFFHLAKKKFSSFERAVLVGLNVPPAIVYVGKK